MTDHTTAPPAPEAPTDPEAPPAPAPGTPVASPAPMGAPGPQAPTAPPRPTVGTYARLAKLDIVDYYIGLPLVFAMSLPLLGARVDTVGLLLLILVAEIAVVAAMVSFDDVTGYRDGSDAANYGSDAARRRLARKPLVAGTLTEPQALRFGRAATVASVVLWTLVVALAPHRPLWAVVGAALCLVASVQYSWGLKISYRGFQEIFLIGLGVGWVLVPYGLLVGHIDGFVIVQALIFGGGPMIFGLYSNTNDADGDRSAGRITVAAQVSPRVNMVFIIALTVAETLLVTGSHLLGIAPWWFPLALLPVIGLRAAQLFIGFVLGDILRARRLAIHTHRATVVLLIGANLVAPFLPEAL
ncbi:UbiA family prenyltransferase [Nocardiopsis lambiniae]|uniref:UbiA family prenyltransferase n=1 Tax=Nocardiopsis lambiniae TaxID=3075539 RepID=A0ABU2M6Q9_9ACTN|nr:UbiA family prenyltransferase [Nocardiopsis sp. DSM 44743]MDT0328327.1 UbiA family prenyltransferase [Nocardiopsis sp. DSM 44743]